MNEGIDWASERARAGSHTQRSLAALAVRAGWTVARGRGKGGHWLAHREGVPRPVAIPSKLNRSIAFSVVWQLEGGGR